MVVQMEGSIAEELYSESLKLSKIELGPNPSSSANDKESDSHGIAISLIYICSNEFVRKL
jgi:hypothetical protein